MEIPTEADAKRILKESLNLEAKEIKRFLTGLAHYVYDITTDNQNIVVRLTREDMTSYFEGAVYWYSVLKNKGVPLPEFIYTELDSAKHGFPVIIMQRLPGKDLGDVYASLSVSQKKTLAKKVVEIQRIAGSLPLGQGFGYATSNNSLRGKPLNKTWLEHLEFELEGSRVRIMEAGIFDVELIQELRDLIESHKEYFSKIQPKCFIDDTTTKNVIVDNGNLSGIVDVDGVCFGDQLKVPALTKMALIGLKFETDYIDYWLGELQINSEQEKAFDIYLALNCLNFMSEMGHSFNQDVADPIDKEKVEWFKKVIKEFILKARSRTH